MKKGLKVSDMLPEYNFSRGVRGKYAKKYQPRRHDPQLLRLARRVMDLPHNRPGTDKSHVASVMFYYQDYFSRVKAAHAR
ncbi:MAG: hypothetical protein HY922_06035 [Elusimicrobia bacterium]|nr:hypothetical protein [Elusimicrobiota bacterium]